MTTSARHRNRLLPAAVRVASGPQDADLIIEAADRGGVDLRLGRALAAWLADAATAGLGDRDYTSVLGHILSTGPPAGEPA